MSGSTAGNPDHTFSKTSQPETAPGKQTLHSLEIKEGGKSKSQKAEWSRVQPERRDFLTWFHFFDLKKKKSKQHRHSQKKPTEEDGEPVGLIVVDNGHTDGVESHQTEHHQVESVCLHHAADRDAQHALLTSQVGSGAAAAAAEIHPRSWHAWRRKRENKKGESFSRGRRGNFRVSHMHVKGTVYK